MSGRSPRKASAVEIWMGGLDDGEVIALEIESKGRKHFADTSTYGRLIAHEMGSRHRA